jgi:hypothetical protein
MVKLALRDSNPAPRIEGVNRLPGIVNYFIGNNSTQWFTNIPTYGGVKYANVYPGIDEVFYGAHGTIEYDFVIRPGARADRIRLSISGAGRVALTQQGALVLHTPSGDIIQNAPNVYQQSSLDRVHVASRYVIDRNGLISVDVGTYDRHVPLIVDPVLNYTSYLGGAGEDRGTGVTTDTAGNVYFTGWTVSPNFPTVAALQGHLDHYNADAYVVKLQAGTLKQLYATYLGGAGADYAYGIAVDAKGSAYITGATGSTDFPTATPFQPRSGGQSDAFISKLSPTGAGLLYSTYLGGKQLDYGYGIAVDGSGEAFVTGTSNSRLKSITSLLPPTKYPYNYSVFVVKMNSSGTAEVYSLRLGGTKNDYADAISVDNTGNAYITGYTTSTNFPLVTPIQKNFGGGAFDAFVTKLNSGGTGLVYSTYLGATGDDYAKGIAVDNQGSAYVTGWTTFAGLPTSNKAFQQSYGGGDADAYVVKMAGDGRSLVYATYLGGVRHDEGHDIVVDRVGNAIVTGSTTSPDFPTAHATQDAYGGGHAGDAFVASLNAAGAGLAYSTYLGGSRDDQGDSIAVDNRGNIYVTGRTDSANFPTTAPSKRYGGGKFDAFIVRVSLQ